MKGDFSRDTFDVTKHFSRVLQQQGRVQLDADWNEQTSILLHYLRTMMADLIGPFAGPAGENVCGFKIGVPNPDPKMNNAWNFSIEKGRYYVDGILCENNDDNVTFLDQKDFPNPSENEKFPAPDDKKYLVYLDVWERHITALEDDAIREKALGGSDTATRAKLIRQVKLLEVYQEEGISEEEFLSLIWEISKDKIRNTQRGCLRARVKPFPDSNAPCIAAPDARYRGPENQLYRVEIHKGGVANEATFKWSRENGSIVTACELMGSELMVQNSRGFNPNQWVELTCEELELRGQHGTLVKVTKVEGNTLTLHDKPDEPENLQKKDKWPTKVRRWDHRESKGNGLSDDRAIKLHEISETEVLNESEVGWIDLEDGIQIQFYPSMNTGVKNLYQTGDYWLIPARTATGNIEWPNTIEKSGIQLPALKPPQGIYHHYAPLAILKPSDDHQNWETYDLRPKFVPLQHPDGVSLGEKGIGGPFDCSMFKQF